MYQQIIWNNGLISNPFQAGGVNTFNTLTQFEEVCDLPAICAGVDDILTYVENIYTIIQQVLGKTLNLKPLVKRLDAQDKQLKAIQSAILDLRRELLRGNRDIGR